MFYVTLPSDSVIIVQKLERTGTLYENCACKTGFQ